jgi:hypothetical protein
VEESSSIVSVLGTARRRNRWRLAAHLRVLAALGKVELDLRRAEAVGTEAAMDVVCVFGRVTVIVPEGADVALSGFSFLASSDSHVDGPPAEDTPKLRIKATAVFAKVRVRSQPGGGRGSLVASADEAPAWVEPVPPVEPVEQPAPESADEAA